MNLNLPRNTYGHTWICIPSQGNTCGHMIMDLYFLAQKHVWSYMELYPIAGEYLDYFYPTPYTIVLGHNDKTFQRVSPNQCAKNCLEERDFVCRSFDYQVNVEKRERQRQTGRQTETERQSETHTERREEKLILYYTRIKI